MNEGAWAGGSCLRPVHASRACGSHGRGVRCQPKSNTVTGVIRQPCCKNRFWTFGVFKLEMTRRAVLPKSNTATGVFWRVRGENRFNARDPFELEIIEICKFV